VASTATDPSTWSRAPDFNEDAEVTSGAFTFVQEGAENGSTSWIITTDDPITVGTTSIEWSQFASAGEITAGDGINKSGQTLSANVSDFSGAYLSADGSNNLQVNLGRGVEADGSDNIRIDEDVSFDFTSTISVFGDIDGGDSNGAIEIDEEASLADTGRAQLSRDPSVQGYAMIQDVTNSQSAMVYLGGSANIVEILHDSGAGNEFTTTEGNQGTTNVYYDSTNGQYEINNETGGSATYSLQIMKA
jgi:hypothetical protein